MLEGRLWVWVIYEVPNLLGWRLDRKAAGFGARRRSGEAKGVGDSGAGSDGRVGSRGESRWFGGGSGSLKAGFMVLQEFGSVAAHARTQAVGLAGRLDRRACRGFKPERWSGCFDCDQGCRPPGRITAQRPSPCVQQCDWRTKSIHPPTKAATPRALQKLNVVASGCQGQGV